MVNTFEKYIKNNELIFKYALGPSSAKGSEIHPYHEILLFKSGDAYFLSENENMKISENTLFIIPRDCYHQFDIKNQNSYLRLVITFPEYNEFKSLIKEIMSEIKIINLKKDSIFLKLFERLILSFEDGCNEYERKLLLNSVFIQILIELHLTADKFITLSSEKSDNLISAVIQYIGINYINPITLESIADDMNVSKSLLSHLFKKELGIPVHKYITEKRLSYAYRLISDGIPATIAAHKCGYNDYSSFYRAYVKMFGKSPKQL